MCFYLLDRMKTISVLTHKIQQNELKQKAHFLNVHKQRILLFTHISFNVGFEHFKLKCVCTNPNEQTNKKIQFEKSDVIVGVFLTDIIHVYASSLLLK